MKHSLIEKDGLCFVIHCWIQGFFTFYSTSYTLLKLMQKNIIYRIGKYCIEKDYEGFFYQL
jgi:hypothetical protein